MDIDERQYAEVDVKHAPRLFKTYWNEAVRVMYPVAIIDEELTRSNMNQWQWVMGPLLQSARQAFGAAVRTQFTVCGKSKPYVGDKVDARHLYHLVGAVWHSVRSAFLEVTPISKRIEQMFHTESEAEKAGLPVAEIHLK